MREALMAALLGAVSDGGEVSADVSEVMNGVRCNMPVAEQVAKLRERAVADEVVHEVGDLVTPKDGNSTRWRGLPWLVLDVDHGNYDFGNGSKSSPSYGQRIDTRVCVVNPGNKVLIYWVDGTEFEAWDEAKDYGNTPKTETAAAA